MKSTILPETVSQKQLAEILGITVQRVGQLVAAGAIFKNDSNSHRHPVHAVSLTASLGRTVEPLREIKVGVSLGGSRLVLLPIFKL
jgi:hypothetical protein